MILIANWRKLLMHHEMDIILTLAGGLSVALVLGFITQKLKMSPILGYLLAGILVGPYSPGFVADAETASQFAEIGIILLMFGVGLHFHLKDLMAVRKIALPGAIVQIAASTVLGIAVTHFFGWSLSAGAIFGVAISVASTVVLIRVLADNRDLHTPIGHSAVGWLIVEDLFTIFVLVLLPALFMQTNSSAGEVAVSLGITFFKICALVVFILIAGKKLLPLFLGYISRTGTRDLFTLSVLVIALGISLGAAKFFGASMALGAFLAGMVVGQSDFSARAAAEALPMRDAFAVLFFVSIGMLFNPSSVPENWPLMLATLTIVLIGKPLTAITVVLFLKQNLKKALSLGIALAQVGEFSFILAALGISLKVLPIEANQAIIFASIISITLNPLLYKGINPFIKLLSRHKRSALEEIPHTQISNRDSETKKVILVGYGPVGRTISKILEENNIDITVIEMNIDTSREINKKNTRGLRAIHGDATQREILIGAGIFEAEAFIISTAGASAKEIVEVVKELNSRVSIFVHTTYISEAKALKDKGIDVVFSGEGSVAISLSTFMLKELGATDEKIAQEYQRLNKELI
jgi:CPA2 family monovalent cation:H+ antiporter-2